MANLVNVHLDSNLLREPAVFVGLGSSVGIGGICRDILIWAAAQQSKDWIVLEVPRFCEQFGYNRQHLLKALPGTVDAPGPERKEMQKAKFCLDERGKTQGKNLADYALFTMLRKNLLFSDGYKAISDEGTLVSYETTSAVNLLQSVRIKRGQRGTSYALKLHPLFVNNCTGGHYTSFRLSDYLNLTTPGGIAWEGGRRLFLRLTWKAARIAHQLALPKKERRAGYELEDYGLLKEAAGLNFSDEKKNAAGLRKMLDRVGQLGNLTHVPELRFSSAYGQQPYSVHMKKAHKQPAAV